MVFEIDTLKKIDKKTKKTVTHEKVENGFIVTLETRTEDSKGMWDYDTQRFIFKTATETQAKLKALIK